MSSSQLSLPSIETLNETQGNPEKFQETVTPLLEKSPKLISELYSHLPFASYQQMMENAKGILFTEFTQDERIGVINSHPRLGTDVSKLEGLSKIEQSYSGGENKQSSASSWGELNAAYESKFGFRFVIFVNKRPIAELVPIIEGILNDPNASKDSEVNRAIQAFLDIANDRLAKLT
ncbi:hypothetical protein DSO57_1017363 [Entomophthora muscae]|nr:hypothetical protein DSO57_1017363 [Entomophthora muscae]